MNLASLRTFVVAGMFLGLAAGPVLAQSIDSAAWDATWIGGWNDGDGVQVVIANGGVIGFFWAGDYVPIETSTNLADGQPIKFIWPRGSQNITLRGVFGYTEPDGSPSGKTPDLIRHATKLLVMRELPLLGNADQREDAQRRYRLTSERTRDQSYTLEALKLHGAFTGDPEIDNLLVAFVRPADVGAA